jgi:hypothetical protein
MLMKPGGQFLAGIPSKGEFLWWLGWRSSTGLSYYLRNKLDYGVLMRHEHVNTEFEIIAVCRIIFENVEVEAFPLNVPHMSLYKFLSCNGSRMDIVGEILND